jgi:glutamate-1-semialdehyde aminotransferase
MGYGPVIIGHGDDRVDDYVNERMRKGVSFSLTSEDEVQAMELLIQDASSRRVAQ